MSDWLDPFDFGVFRSLYFIVATTYFVWWIVDFVQWFISLPRIAQRYIVLLSLRFRWRAASWEMIVLAGVSLAYGWVYYLTFADRPEFLKAIVAATLIGCSVVVLVVLLLWKERVFAAGAWPVLGYSFLITFSLATALFHPQLRDRLASAAQGVAGVLAVALGLTGAVVVVLW